MEPEEKGRLLAGWLLVIGSTFEAVYTYLCYFSHPPFRGNMHHEVVETDGLTSPLLSNRTGTAWTFPDSANYRFPLLYSALGTLRLLFHHYSFTGL